MARFIAMTAFVVLLGVGSAKELYIDHNRNGEGPLLGECASDCDDNSDCAAGLVCWQRDQWDNTSVPGCEGNPALLDDEEHVGWDFCYNPGCNESTIYNVDWDYLVNEDGTPDSLVHSSSVQFDASTLSLTLTAELEYIGLSADGNFDDEYDLGTTYWIDLQTFGGSTGHIEDAGTCANRRPDDYDALNATDFWEYTTDPSDLAESPNRDRMAYPPSDWNLTSLDCHTVRYQRTFSWTQLTECDDIAGDALVTVTETDSHIMLRGTFFVELVSPYSMSSEYYRAFPLVENVFDISLSRSVNVMASTGVQLFITSLIAFSRDDADPVYEMTILVQSADFVELGMDNAVYALTGPEGVTVENVETVTTECLVASSYTCAQIFTATISTETECSSPDSAVDLGGDWQFAFTPQCGDADDTAACETFLSTLGDSGKVALDVVSKFQDDCAYNLFNVTFLGALTFYTDDDFTKIANESYVIGQDTIYGEIVVDYLADEDGADYEFLNVTIETVYVCTAADDDIAELEATLNSDDVPGVGGCLSSLIDDDGPYTVIGDGAGPYEGTTAYADAANDRARFSFLTFNTPKETIAVHVQLLLTLLTDNGVQRRRMQLHVDPPSDVDVDTSAADDVDVDPSAVGDLDPSTVDQVRHYMGTVSVAEAVVTDDGASSSVGAGEIIGIFAAVTVAIIVVVVVLYLVLRSKKRQTSEDYVQLAQTV